MLLPCLACDCRLRSDEYFDACHDYNRARDVVMWTCPRCGNRDEIRVFPGELGFGYARGRRFDVQDRVPVPGLRRHRYELRLEICLDGRVWRVLSRELPGPGVGATAS
ncbi:hypothetical protein OG320_12565 [Microbispora sp. NBC_01189]|uniref:Uncharacterized protein n=2 Tax=Microbispora TaxID=2005 RepID=A0A5J5K6H7_9ACTN|nr:MULTISPECIES: hypothetical protein [Microbispora]KAA9378861.1 hypothetical protein F5972_11495 [Microbispora cellulosiformans]WSS09393.1 hypothetical protein OG320_12565 [Microbispora sp. NBC_01189]GIH33514.1 hypothetical protein Mam01_36780 [Microbispora amethystogenes]